MYNALVYTYIINPRAYIRDLNAADELKIYAAIDRRLIPRGTTTLARTRVMCSQTARAVASVAPQYTYHNIP